MTDTASTPTGEGRPVLTDRQGHSVYDNQNQRTIGARGPATLENYQFLEKICHFDRERIPERVVHARGPRLSATSWHPACAARSPSPSTPGPRCSPSRASAPTWPFPDLIHSQKPDPVTFRQEPNRIFDFISQTPEAMHMVSLVFGPRGIPSDFRHMQGFGVNTYKWVNADGDTVLVKYHWVPKQGVRSLTAADAANIQATELGSATRDLFGAIELGDYPEWELKVQIMSDEEHPELSFDPLDDTKTWPEETFPLRSVGRMVLDRNVDNAFNDNEQIAFGTGVLVDGLDFSDDKMLVGRTFSYSDTQRYRVGPNYLQLPVNRPRSRVATNQQGGQMQYSVDEVGLNPNVNYEPSITGGLGEATLPTHYEQGPVITGRLTRKQIPRTNDYEQPGLRYLMSEQWEKDDLVANLVFLLGQCDRPIQERMVWHLLLCEDELGNRVGEGLGIKASDVAGMEPLNNQVLNDTDKGRLTNLGNNGPRKTEGMTMTHCVSNERLVVER